MIPLVCDIELTFRFDRESPQFQFMEQRPLIDRLDKTRDFSEK